MVAPGRGACGMGSGGKVVGVGAGVAVVRVG